MCETLDAYIALFDQMNRAVVKGYRAPHKPLLLLSIIELIDEGKIVSNKIRLSDELIRKFSDLWKRYVDDGCDVNAMIVADGIDLMIGHKYPFKCNIANPFFHLNHESFWTLIESKNYVKKSVYSIKNLQICYEYAVISDDLFELMKDTNIRNKMQSRLEGMLED